MDKMTLIPDADFYDISKKVKELRNTIYTIKQDIKIDFITLIFARIDELLEAYSDALNNNSSNDKFNEIKNALKENCYLLQTALTINEIEEVKQIAYTKVNKLELLLDYDFSPNFSSSMFTYNNNNRC